MAGGLYFFREAILIRVRVKTTRDGSNAIRTMDLEEYLRGVLPSEIKAGSCPLEAQCAQAIAARTYAALRVQQRTGKLYDVDDTAGCQAYGARPPTATSDRAVTMTRGIVLTFGGALIDAVYTDSNGGRTKSALERWGSACPYLVDKPDPYDNSTKVSGHGVGMSQTGAAQAAKQGLSYKAILAFYYPGATIATMKEESMVTTIRQGSKGDDVRKAQALLGIHVDGSFGAKTLDAVKAFQTAEGLTADGVVGPRTWAALEKRWMDKPVDYKQFDARWASTVYTSVNNKSQTLKNSGCAPAAMADYIATRIDKRILPTDLAAYAVECGCRTASSGTSWGFFERCGAKWGFAVTRTTKIDDVIAALAKGKLVIVSMGKGYFTSSGHIMLIWRCDGKYMYVCNPGSSSKDKASLSIFKSQAKQYFILG